MTTHQIVLIPGDGIGPEVADATTRVLQAAGAPVEWVEHHAGVAALETHGEVLPEETLDAVRERGLALKGPCTTPVGDGFTSVNVQLRKRLDLVCGRQTGSQSAGDLDSIRGRRLGGHSREHGGTL